MDDEIKSRLADMPRAYRQMHRKMCLFLPTQGLYMKVLYGHGFVIITLEFSRN